MCSIDVLSAGDKNSSIHNQYIRLLLAMKTAASGARSDNHLSVLMDSLSLIQASPPEQVPRHMTSVFLRLWLAYSRISPETLYVATVNTLMYSKSGSQLTEAQLTADPLLILRCLQSCR